MAANESEMEIKGIAPTILVISDRPETGPLWAFSLQRKNWKVVLEASVDNAIGRWEDEIPDMILIDTRRPDSRILNLVRKLRAETLAPILMLVHSITEDQILETYLAGVDECIIKPIGPGLIIAKVRSWMRRNWTMTADAVENVRLGDCVLMVSGRMLLVGNRPPVKLTNLELRLLHLLMSRSPRTISHDEIIKRVWGYAGDVDNAALKNMIYRLRQKIEVDAAKPRYLITVVGVGYKFEVG